MSETVPRLDSRYGVRPIRFTDTGERAKIVTIDGESVACEPDEATVALWLSQRYMVAITREFNRDVSDAERWHEFRRLPRFRRLLKALRDA